MARRTIGELEDEIKQRDRRIKELRREYNALIDNHNRLVRRWNKYLPLINRQPTGRPLGASEAQAATVRKLHRQGRSLRSIAAETSLSFSTVRTIVGKLDGTDRTTRHYRKRIDLDGRKPVKEAKGLA